MTAGQKLTSAWPAITASALAVDSPPETKKLHYHHHHLKLMYHGDTHLVDLLCVPVPLTHTVHSGQVLLLQFSQLHLMCLS